MWSRKPFSSWAHNQTKAPFQLGVAMWLECWPMGCVREWGTPPQSQNLKHCPHNPPGSLLSLFPDLLANEDPTEDYGMAESQDGRWLYHWITTRKKTTPLIRTPNWNLWRQEMNFYLVKPMRFSCLPLELLAWSNSVLILIETTCKYGASACELYFTQTKEYWTVPEE